MTRADLAAVVAVYRKESKKFDSLTSWGLWGGVVTGWLLVLLRPALGLINDWNPVFFLGGVTIGLATVGAAFWHRRRALAELQLRCASCDTPFLGRGKWKDVVSRAELVVTTGVCPSCGNEFVATEASTPPSV